MVRETYLPRGSFLFELGSGIQQTYLLRVFFVPFCYTLPGEPTARDYGSSGGVQTGSSCGQNCLTAATEAANSLKNGGIQIVMVGVGSGIDSSNLQLWASQGPDGKLAFSSGEYGSLNTIVLSVASAKVCGGND